MADKRIIGVGGDIALGVACGAALGAAFGDLQMGLAIGAATGATSGLAAFAMNRLSSKPKEG